MVDTRRLHELLGLIEWFGAKPILINGGRQLPSIGPGGMFDRLTTCMPVEELKDARCTSDPTKSGRGQRARLRLRVADPPVRRCQTQQRLSLVRAEGFVVDELERTRLGIVERLAAHKVADQRRS